MPGAADMVVLALGPTVTYVRRDAVFVPCEPWAHADHRDGTLTIVLQGSRRAGAKVETDTYGVQEELDEPHPPGARSFLLLNDTDPTQPDVYRCVVGGTRQHCTCMAGRCWVQCKHHSALSELVNGGLI